MISIIIIVMNIETLIINISTVSLIYTSRINDIHRNIIMVRYTGGAVMMAMYIL